MLFAWTGLAPETVSAQRAQPRVQGGGSSGGGDRSAGNGDRAGGGRTTAPREGPRTAARPSSPRETPREAPRTAERPAEPATNNANSDNAAQAEAPSRRARGDNASVGRAVARRGPPPSAREGDRYYRYYWPGYGYSGFYPWGYGGFGLGGYYGGYYSPWYGGYGYGYGAPYYYGWNDDGSLRLKMKPRDATVFVDGYYVGRVDDYDGVFQRLRLEPGPHRIEVRAEGYEPMTFEVRILPDRTITYEESLKPQP
jgi:hypothetical protein